ncbi:required for meiotic nuclear division protein 1 homolog isoform X2 [Lingula anatina]|uniref:Required for meiotic nuclear division protein 1 homolog isoform X2 n=1 Tax=Lingula anatina TaxID=7574 RepID=A0A2R2MS96_LINAN|nr:required for meiotic nuclear division protein 1 homolog isoform X2 [Lingula anatina]|eukprot:XP_023933136.1 required for meiotic nuclear division protein 1 homolog isoform X2 [Lingula anatina]
MIWKVNSWDFTLKKGNIRIPPQNKENKEQLLLEKFAISHGLMLAVQLDYCETQLQKFIEKLAYIPEDMKTKGKMTTEPRQAVRYIGELYDLRHRVLLESEYMETPEFFWNREELEGLFDNVRRHLELKNRVDVMKSKLSLCIDLMDNIQEALTHQHGARLEWIIIILIASEILIELLRWKGATVWAWLWGEEAAEKSDKLEQLNQEDSDPISRD